MRGAATAGAGLAALADARPDVVVLDVMLPDQSGWDVLAAIRQRSDVYILMLTARGTEAERILGLTRGADDSLVKPFSPGELLARLTGLSVREQGWRHCLRHGCMTGATAGPGRRASADAAYPAGRQGGLPPGSGYGTRLSPARAPQAVRRPPRWS